MLNNVVLFFTSENEVDEMVLGTILSGLVTLNFKFDFGEIDFREPLETYRNIYFVISINPPIGKRGCTCIELKQLSELVEMLNVFEVPLLILTYYPEGELEVKDELWLLDAEGGVGVSVYRGNLDVKKVESVLLRFLSTP